MHRVGKVGIFPGLEGFCDAEGVVFCEFRFRSNFLFKSPPNTQHVEERGSGTKCVCRLTVARIRIQHRKLP